MIHAWRLIIIVAGICLAFEGALGVQIPERFPTFSKDVAPIFYSHCVSCHRPEQAAPMSLVTYAEARPWARSIREKVLEGTMPPWHADAPQGTFLNERHLTELESATIVQWADHGAPEGDPRDLPPPPEYPAGWNIGRPDAVIAMPAGFEVPATGEIPYQYFQVSTGFSEDKWVRAIEIRPSEPSVVHHVLVYSRPPGGSQEEPAVFRPVRSGGETRPERRIAGLIRGLLGRAERRSNRLGSLIATTAPGTNAQIFPTGRALLIQAGSILTFQVHYTANGTPRTDRSRVGFVFDPEPPQREVRIGAFVNTDFVIPAGRSDHRVDSAIEFLRDAQILALFPHTHVRGTRWEYRVTYPNGRSEIVLAVPNYDFNWQTYYEFTEPIEVPAGSRLEGIAHYDNSAANPNNPDPDAEVRWGDQTWEEMQYTGIALVVDDSREAP